MYDIGPENLEELLRATQSEAVRSLARTVYVEKAYDLRGVDSEDMLATLNDKLNPFGVNIDQVTIANVELPLDVAQSLQNSTSYASRTKEQIRLHELKVFRRFV
jgi:regulator of protease activity HflC (stomatin/prohibitin superfamily)